MAMRPTIVCLVCTIYDGPELQKHYTSKDMKVFYSDSKTDLKLRCKCIKFHIFKGAQDIFSRLTAVCGKLLPHNPYRLPQHYKRQVCGTSFSCKHQHLWVSLILEHYFRLNYMGTVHHWQPFWSRKSFRFIGQCWYFNPQWTPEQAIIKVSYVKTVLVSWEKCAVTKCLYIYIVYIGVCWGV